MVVMQWAQRKQTGFTIVELLIVIVVIAILAAITIVAYNGIRQSATKSALASALSQTSRQIMAYAAKNADQYPSSLAAASVSSSGGVRRVVAGLGPPGLIPRLYYWMLYDSLSPAVCHVV